MWKPFDSKYDEKKLMSFERVIIYHGFFIAHSECHYIQGKIVTIGMEAEKAG